jgi:hypothetical protein
MVLLVIVLIIKIQHQLEEPFLQNHRQRRSVVVVRRGVRAIIDGMQEVSHRCVAMVFVRMLVVAFFSCCERQGKCAGGVWRGMAWRTDHSQRSDLPYEESSS